MSAQQRPATPFPASAPERPVPRQVPFQRGVASPAATPAPAAPAPTQPPAEPITADQMYRAWPMVLAQLKKLSPATRAFFNNVTPSVSAQGTLEVLFPAESETAFQVAQKESNASQFAAALTRAFGRPVPFVLRQAKAAPANRPLDGAVRPVQQVPGIARPAASAAPMPSAPFSPALNRATQQAQAPAPAPAPAVASAVPAAPVASAAPSMEDAPEPEYAPSDDADFDAEAAEAAFAAPSTHANDGTGKMEDFLSVFGGASFEQYE